jgi:hypothetical protein
MKKFLSVIAVSITVALSVMILSACSNGGKDDPDTDPLFQAIISSDLSGFIVDLSFARQIGITTRGNLQSEGDTVSVARTSNSQGNEDEGNVRRNDELVLVAVDDQDNMTEIEMQCFEGSIITAGDVDLEIYKMKVFGEFTAIAYISTFWRDFFHKTSENLEYVSVDSATRIYNRIVLDSELLLFDYNGYQNNDYVRSYLIHNQTGKIYSMEEFGAFDVFNVFIRPAWTVGGVVGCYAWGGVGGTLHDVSINNDGNLKIRRILDNQDYLIIDAFRDACGWTYVINSHYSGSAGMDYTDETNRTIFRDRYSNPYHLASNGRVYLVVSSTWPLFPFPHSVMKNGQSTSISVDDSFDYLFFGAGNSNYSNNGFMRNGVFYRNDAIWSSGGGGLQHIIGFDGIRHVPLIVDRPSSIGAIFDRPQDLNPTDLRFVSVGQPTFAFSLVRNSLFIFKLDAYVSETCVKTVCSPNNGPMCDCFFVDILEYYVILEGVQLGTPINGAPIFVHSTPSGSVRYTIQVGDDGRPEAVLFSETTFTSNIITIQPLN